MPKKAAATEAPPPQHTVQEAAQKVAESDLPMPETTQGAPGADLEQNPWVGAPDTPYPTEAYASEQAVTDAADATETANRSNIGFIELVDTTTHINALWYGREGSGKTTAVAAMANQGQVLAVNAEAGIKTRPLRELGIKVENIKVWPRPGTRITFDGLEALYWQMHAELEEDPAAWAGVFFDSLTEIVQLLLEDIVKGAVEKATKKGQSRDRFFVDRADYGVMSGQVRTLIRRFRDLPCHFAATCLERRDIDDDTSKVLYGPALTPALQNDVLGYMDLVLYVKAEELGEVSEYRALTRPQGRYRAKDRYGATPRVLINPSFERVAAYVTGDLIEADDKEAQASLELHRLHNEQAAAATDEQPAKATTRTRKPRAAAKETGNAETRS
jgi:hypothetical protein